MAFNNGINANSTGIQTLSSAGAWSGSTVTQNGVLYGGATNAVSSLAVGATGTVLIGNTGAAPSMSATPSVTSITLGSGTALADYVQGTFTPAILMGGAATGVVYANQDGAYTRIGNRVYYTLRLILSDNGSSTGTVQITGFPITAAAGLIGVTAVNYFSGLTLTAGFNSVALLHDASATTATLYRSGSAVGPAAISNAGTDVIADFFTIYIEGFYQV